MKEIPAISWSLLLLLVMAACSPKNEEVTDEQIETGNAAQALDTIANTRKDAVRTDENNISPTLPMPQPVLQLLTQRYPGWEQPNLTTAAKQHATESEQGPTLVRGDFNGDSRQDYALQLQQKDKLVIAAVLNEGNDNWKVYELKQDKLLADNDSLKSTFYLYFISKGEKLKHTNTAADTEAPFDALGVGTGKKSTAYLFRNGKFNVYRMAN